MKTLHIRLALLTFCAVIIWAIVAGSQSLLERHVNRAPQRHHEDVTLAIVDKQQPGYSSGFSLGARRNAGTATLSSGHQFAFTCKFVRMDDLADIYTLEITLPGATNLVRTIRFNGEKLLIYETETQRIEVAPPTQ